MNCSPDTSWECRRDKGLWTLSGCCLSTHSVETEALRARKMFFTEQVGPWNSASHPNKKFFKCRICIDFQRVAADWNNRHGLLKAKKKVSLLSGYSAAFCCLSFPLPVSPGKYRHTRMFTLHSSGNWTVSFLRWLMSYQSEKLLTGFQVSQITLECGEIYLVVPALLLCTKL